MGTLGGDHLLHCSHIWLALFVLLRIRMLPIGEDVPAEPWTIDYSLGLKRLRETLSLTQLNAMLSIGQLTVDAETKRRKFVRRVR